MALGAGNLGPPQTFVGARARFKINGNKVAFAGGVSGEENIGYEPVDVLDLLSVYEHTPTSYLANLNANVFRVIGQSLKQLGIVPFESEILTSGAMEAAIDDAKITGRTAYLFMGVRASGQQFNVEARSHVTTSVSFVAIRCLDESQI